MGWTIQTPKRVKKHLERLPVEVQAAFALLAKELEALGPYRSNWSHYSKLRGTKSVFHCHIVSGRPTYVAVWEVIDKTIFLAEVLYVGTHEGAPY